MRKLNPISLAVSVCLAAGGTTTFAAETKEEPQKIIITGSHIKRIENESASPLLVITQEDILRSGATTLSGLLETTVLNSGGALNNQQTSGFTPGSSSYNLRGLRSDRTLVLVDGRRLASYPFGQNGSVAFVDLNTIPLAEIESIEILKDGASAVYGSDAISGVVNVITKRTYNGNQLRFKAVHTNSNYKSNDLSFLSGFSNDDNDFVFVAEYQKYDALKGGHIEDTSTLNLSELSRFSYPGTFITVDNGNLVANPNPAAECGRVEDASEFYSNVTGNVCVNDWASDRQLIPENERKSFSFKWTHYFGENALYTGLSTSQIDTKSDVDFGFLGAEFFIAGTNPFNPIGEDMLFARGFSEIGLQTIETEAKNTNFVVGVEGLLGEYDYDINLSHSLTKVKEVYADGWFHLDDAIALFDSIDNETFNPFPLLTSDQINALTTSFNHDGKSYQTGLAAKLSGELTEIDNGTVYFASGIEIRKEFIRDTSDPAILNGEVVGLGSSAAEGDRNVTAIFGEFIIPTSEDTELNLALRYDDYSDFGSSVNPKVSFRYTPIDSILVRASWGTGFRAPNLFELYTDEVSGSVSGVPFVKLANPDLEAESSESFNLGVVFDFNERFMTSVDVWEITVDDMIANLGVNTILNTLDEDGNRVFQDLLEFNEDGSFNRVVDPFLNLDKQTAQGIDLSANLQIIDSLEFKINASHLMKLKRVNLEIPEAVDFDGDYLFPRNRLSTNLIWTSGDFTHTLSSYYIGEHGDDDFGFKSYTKLDYQMDYSIGDHHLNLMVGNINDKQPPTDTATVWPYFEQRMYSPLGRTTSLTWTYKF